MLPWGHAAVGYLCYTAATRHWHRRPPAGPAVLSLAVGTQLPDLIDKPFAWSFGLLPSGRSLGHSLLIAGAIGVLAWRFARRYDRQSEAGAFLLGLLTHIVADVAPAVVARDWEPLGALLWPLTPAYRYPGEMERTVLGFFLDLRLAELSSVGSVLTVLAVGAWLYDGRPGVATLAALVTRRRS
ncbi:metal-dependent hydrolase [Halorubrum ejinorense]|uniref:Metal-dependent hydrolase n=1 Tax=Halorubrum ejinorense TaxID=425309 RepID=A0AAV3SWJ2_9EURY